MQGVDKELLDVPDDTCKPWLTILTPSWNRAHLLPRLYRSIAENLPETHQIEWLLVDDGSTDSTADCAAAFQAENAGFVRYSRINHGGKHRALNAGFEQALGQWILIIDSDDWFLPDGIDLALREIEKAEAQGADGLFLPMNVVDRAEQYTFAKPGHSVSFADRVNQQHWFDTSFVFSSRVCRTRFPEFAGENYLAPGAFLYDLDPAYRFYLSDRVCVAVEYQADGLSHNNLRARMSSPIGNTLTYSRMLAMPLNSKRRLRALVNWGRFWWHCILRSKTPVGPFNVLQLAILPLAWPATLRDLWVRRKS